MDIGFAITATSSESDEIFQKIKDTIKAIVDTYGIAKIHYSLLVFGDNANRRISFKDDFNSPENLKSFVDLIPKRSGGPALDKALQESLKLFESGEGARPGVKKVLVVITDKKSVSSAEQVKRATTTLDNNNIRVIPVGIGGAVDSNELRIVSSDERDVIAVLKEEDPMTLADRIMRKAREGAVYSIAMSQGWASRKI